MDGIEEPIHLIEHALDEVVYVKMKGDRELKGKLHVCLSCLSLGL